ncbi:prolyl endopeptidase [Artemisia annua]|uniref:Prolyl endopeptidase n=1 Tax=Artemisia annua TaxID=35608 RepID=A0A2U1KX04_ARTAN|nr:prolyl endopeptidase [Artemisia annua]
MHPKQQEEKKKTRMNSGSYNILIITQVINLVIKVFEVAPSLLKAVGDTNKSFSYTTPLNVWFGAFPTNDYDISTALRENGNKGCIDTFFFGGVHGCTCFIDGAVDNSMVDVDVVSIENALIVPDVTTVNLPEPMSVTYEAAEYENTIGDLYYHFLGTNQYEDILCWENTENPQYMLRASVTEDGKHEAVVEGEIGKLIRVNFCDRVGKIGLVLIPGFQIIIGRQ